MSITAQDFIDYLTNSRESIADNGYYLSGKGSGVRFLLAFDEEGYISNEIQKEKEKKLIEIASKLPKYINKIIINENKSKEFYNFLTIEVCDSYLILNKYIVDSLYYQEDKGEWIVQYVRKNTQLLFYDSLDLVFKNSKNKAQPVRLGHGGIGGTGLKESPFKGMPLFYAVDDFERDKIGELPTTIAYGDLLRAQRDGLSRKEILQRHLKKSLDLDNVINFNKFSVTELYTIVKIMTELDPITFLNFVTWFRQNRELILKKQDCPFEFKAYRENIIASFILHQINVSDDEESKREARYIARDYIRMCRQRRRKIKVDFSTFNGLNERHNKLYASIENKMLKKDKDIAKPFKFDKMYQPLLNEVRKRSNPFKILKRPIDLIIEGNKMGHCVGSYVYSVKHGSCVILTVELEGVHYTLEVTTVLRENELKGYYLAQMQSRFNGGVKDKKHKETVITFLNQIQINPAL